MLKHGRVIFATTKIKSSYITCKMMHTLTLPSHLVGSMGARRQRCRYFTAAKAGINMVACIDDYILISPKATAQHHFDTLASILLQLGLLNNPEKQTPPCKALTCLGIRIHIDANTLSIDPQSCIPSILSVRPSNISVI